MAEEQPQEPAVPAVEPENIQPSTDDISQNEPQLSNDEAQHDSGVDNEWEDVPEQTDADAPPAGDILPEDEFMKQLDEVIPEMPNVLAGMDGWSLEQQQTEDAGNDAQELCDKLGDFIQESVLRAQDKNGKQITGVADIMEACGLNNELLVNTNSLAGPLEVIQNLRDTRDEAMTALMAQAQADHDGTFVKPEDEDSPDLLDILKTTVVKLHDAIHPHTKELRGTQPASHLVDDTLYSCYVKGGVRAFRKLLPSMQQRKLIKINKVMQGHALQHPVTKAKESLKDKAQITLLTTAYNALAFAVGFLPDEVYRDQDTGQESMRASPYGQRPWIEPTSCAELAEKQQAVNENRLFADNHEVEDIDQPTAQEIWGKKHKEVDTPLPGATVLPNGDRIMDLAGIGQFHARVEKGKVTGIMGPEDDDFEEPELFEEAEKFLPKAIRDCVLKIYDVQQNKGLPIKSKLIDSLPDRFKTWFTNRADVHHLSPMRKFAPEEMGMHAEIFAHLNNNLREQQRTMENPHQTVNGEPKSYGPRLVLQDRKPDGTFGARAAIKEEEGVFDPLNGATLNRQFVAMAIMVGISGGRITAEDLGMKRVGTVWKKMHAGCVAFVERQVALEAWVNKQRAEIDSKIKFFRQQAHDMQLRAKGLQSQNRAMKTFLQRADVRKAFAEHSIELPPYIYLDVSTELKVRQTKVKPTVPGRDRRSKEAKKWMESNVARKPLKPTLKIRDISVIDPPPTAPGAKRASKKRARKASSVASGSSGAAGAAPPPKKKRAPKGKKARAELEPQRSQSIEDDGTVEPSIEDPGEVGLGLGDFFG